MPPHGPREPGRRPERLELAGGPHGPGEMPATKPGAPEVEERPGRAKPAGMPPHRADTLPPQPKPPRGSVPEATVPEKQDTVPATPPLALDVDTTKSAESPATPEPVKPSAKLQLEIPHFATDSWGIQAADSARLKADAESLKVHPDVKFVIVGHCDPRASESYNRKLGLKRAEAIRDFLVAAGVDAGRVSVRSDGEKRPISTKPDEYWLDRRVEFELK
jgi:peptidoglycan-associated lipoprotein